MHARNLSIFFPPKSLRKSIGKSFVLSTLRPLLVARKTPQRQGSLILILTQTAAGLLRNGKGCISSLSVNVMLWQRQPVGVGAISVFLTQIQQVPCKQVKCWITLHH